ncbi:CDP-archaeol synthase [Candidatus Dojkabacteria bacterium]|nr:CDP-archaeol synthase [Candidatus Dojkabacteria bacterium]
MLNDILFALWFFIPAGIANSVPVFVAKLPLLKKFNYPIDFGKKWRGIRVFGDHKTIRGFVTGISMAIITVFIEKAIYAKYAGQMEFIVIDYENISAVILGFCLGFGALIGDAVKSFFKRRQSIKPGEAWIPFDQLDYIIGGILLSLLYIRLSISIYLLIAILYFVMHPISTVIGYLLGLKKKPI